MSIILLINALIILYIIIKSLYFYISIKLLNNLQNKESLLDSISLNALPFYLNQEKINLFIIFSLFSFTFLSEFIFNTICMCSSEAVMLSDEDLHKKWYLEQPFFFEKNFNKFDLKFLQEKLRESEQITYKINFLNEKPKYFENCDINNTKIDYNYIYDFKKYKITRVKDGLFFPDQFSPNFEHLILFEDRFNEAVSEQEKIIISLEILITENKKECFQNFKILSINKSLKEIFPYDMHQKDFINKILNNIIKNVDNSYNILYWIKSHPTLPVDEKKKLLKIFNSSLSHFLSDYKSINTFFLPRLPLDLEIKDNIIFKKNFEKLLELNLKNFELIKKISLINNTNKVFQNIIITNPTPQEPKTLYDDYIGEGDLARILDTTTANSSSEKEKLISKRKYSELKFKTNSKNKKK